MNSAQKNSIGKDAALIRRNAQERKESENAGGVQFTNRPSNRSLFASLLTGRVISLIHKQNLSMANAKVFHMHWGEKTQVIDKKTQKRLKFMPISIDLDVVVRKLALQ